MGKILLRVFLLAVVGVLGLTATSVYFYRAPSDASEKTVILAPGIGVRGILNQLHAEGLTPPTWLIVLPVIASGEYKTLKAGEYNIPANLSPAQVLRMIARGQVVVHKITIPEGWNVMQVRAALMAEPLLTGELPAAIPEGSIFPDTIQFARGDDRSKLLARMQQARQQRLATAWAARSANLPITTPEQALILASVVEKETGLADERTLVAGVFTNRLRIGMKLQSDPTVVYGIEQRMGKPLGRALTTDDLATDTPYNSYTRDGLPPTPICNPGQAALEAVLNPAATDALFFVATGNGGHNFSATMQGHEANVATYRKAIGKPVNKPATAANPKKRATRKR